MPVKMWAIWPPAFVGLIVGYMMAKISAEIRACDAEIKAAQSKREEGAQGVSRWQTRMLALGIMQAVLIIGFVAFMVWLSANG